MVGQSLVVSSSITRKTRRLIETAAQVCLPDGTLVAESRATHYVVDNQAGDDNLKESQENA